MCSRQRYGAGAGESGKSTVLKQMKIIHDNGYSPDEALQKKSMVHANAIQSIGAILNGMHELKIPLASPKNQDYARFIQGIIARKEELGPMTKEIYTAIKQLWADKSVQVAFTRKDEYYLNDSARYFLDSLERIYDPKYIPTEQDILHTRVATMGVIEVTFTMKNKIWRVFDVGGQRSQRKKWIHCFDDAKAVIFVAALSEYDQLLSEDNATVRYCILFAFIHFLDFTLCKLFVLYALSCERNFREEGQARETEMYKRTTSLWSDSLFLVFK
uniref:G-protein alpha subunit n=2 Tax=Parascaris univalens TaxID=6257 RepID=A0A915CIW2_PARUN